jgi:hypothetical protein
MKKIVLSLAGVMAAVAFAPEASAWRVPHVTSNISHC